MRVLLIPIKDTVLAKTRLKGLLSAEERQRLVWAMFEDVAAAVVESRGADRIVMVTSADSAVQHGRSRGWEILLEESQSSESDSVDWASKLLASQGADSVLRLPADVPLISAADVTDLLEVELNAPAALIVPSRDGTGTNAILRTPPCLFRSHFGPNSFSLHREEASRVGAQFIVKQNYRLALDIDDPADLELFLQTGRGTETETFQLLSDLSIGERLKAH